ncbi:MAG: alpha/beta hydrolase [Roseobacter sp.]
MGAFLAMEAIKDSVLTGQFDTADRLNSIILASPDIDIDLFRAQLEQIEGSVDRIAVLLSEDDSALRISRGIDGGVPRVGASDLEQLADLGVVAIDLSVVDDSPSGSHSKFAGSPEIVQLIGRCLDQNQRFDRYQRGKRLDKITAGIPITVAFG